MVESINLAPMIVSAVWGQRIALIGTRSIELLWVVVICLSSELGIWALSRLLAPAKLEYFSPILGMLVVFVVISVAYLVLRRGDDFYQALIKPKVDFINSHLGVGFPIPIVMLDKNALLNGRDIACIMGNFVSWTVCFYIALAAMRALAQIRAKYCQSPDIASIPPGSRGPSPCPINQTTHWRRSAQDSDDPEKGAQSDEGQSICQPASMDCKALTEETASWSILAIYYPILLAVLLALLVGGPVLSATGDGRILDGCILWLIWITFLRVQKIVKAAAFLEQTPRIKNTLVTFMNPVLMTTLLLLGYTRARAAATAGVDIIEILSDFSRGTPLYALWTSSVTGIPLATNPESWFGAGDAALSILECGILIWGFKLYECRRQLFSAAGLLTVLISVASAATNVFLSTLTGHALGLGQAEALAFAARSTTLALAKPAMEAVGGNLAVNAILVVSNGILGQLMYPFAPELLGIAGPRKPRALRNCGPTRDLPSREATLPGHLQQGPDGKLAGDDPATVAAGIAVGINGAAMGVAYLYESKSHAAPYAALAMTVFGVVTVVFTTVDPFKSLVLRLAGL